MTNDNITVSNAPLPTEPKRVRRKKAIAKVTLLMSELLGFLLAETAQYAHKDLNDAHKKAQEIVEAYRAVEQLAPVKRTYLKKLSTIQREAKRNPHML